MVNYSISMLVILLLCVCVQDAFDTELMVTTLKQIYEGKPVHVPRYDFSTCQRLVYVWVFGGSINYLIISMCEYTVILYT